MKEIRIKGLIDLSEMEQVREAIQAYVDLGWGSYKLDDRRDIVVKDTRTCYIVEVVDPEEQYL